MKGLHTGFYVKSLAIWGKQIADEIPCDCRLHEETQFSKKNFIFRLDSACDVTVSGNLCEIIFIDLPEQMEQ